MRTVMHGRHSGVRAQLGRMVCACALGSIMLAGTFRIGVAQGPDARLGVSSVSASAQERQNPRPGAKDPGTATLISVLVVGGGQMYAGELGRGLLMLGGAYGAVIAGAVLSSSASVDFNTGELDEGSLAPLYIGVLAATGIWIYGIVDAAPSARRMNAKRGLASGARVGPVLATSRGGQQLLGLKFAF